MISGIFVFPFYIWIAMRSVRDYAEDMSVSYVFPCFSFLVIACLVALLGAIMAFRGRSWRGTLFVSFFSVFTLGPLFLGTLMGAIAFLLLALAREEFHEKITYRYGPELLGMPTTRLPPIDPR